MSEPTPPDACPLPTEPPTDEVATIRRLLGYDRIAVVGLSDDPSRPSYGVASYLLSVGKTIFPVNPNHERVLGLKCYARLQDVPKPLELVNVFRRPEHCAGVAREAAGAGAAGLWLQSGIRSAEARQVAADAGMAYVENRCIMVEHMQQR